MIFKNIVATRLMTTTTTNTLKKRIGLGQITSTNNKESNFQQCKLLIEKAAQANVDLFCLPENFGFISGGISQFESRDNAEYLDQPNGVIERFRELAKSNNIWLSLGGFNEKIKDNPDNMIYNTHLIIDSNGSLVSKYNKMHLFDVDIPSKGVKMNESKIVLPGNELVVCDSPVGKLGLTVCYDLRFPELYCSLRRLGAQIILVPAAFMYSTGEAHWKVLLQSRAIENQCYVVAAAQTGDHHSKRKSYGHSMIIDPWGKVIHELSGENQIDIAYADIDLDYLSTVRDNIPVMNHKKLDCYKI